MQIKRADEVRPHFETVQVLLRRPGIVMGTAGRIGSTPRFRRSLVPDRLAVETEFPLAPPELSLGPVHWTAKPELRDLKGRGR
jgi:hypothetical protein